MAPQATQADSVLFSHDFSEDSAKRQKPINFSITESWPKILESPLAWVGSQYLDEQKYIYHLTEPEIQEIELALAHFKGLELDGSEINRARFPLPTLKDKIRDLSTELHQGKGFFVIRGLNPSKYSAEDTILLYLGVSSHIGQRRGRQDDSGLMLMHIRNAKNMDVAQEERPARDSNLGLTFHTDMFCDILALLTLGCASEGGNHLIAPTYTIYNKLAESRPDLLELLAMPIWQFDPRSLHASAHKRPCLYYQDGRAILNFGRNRLLFLDDPEAVVRPDFKPSVTPEQMEALEEVQAIAQSCQLELLMKPGDLGYINNFGVLHSRSSFVDTDEKTRHLVRLWLKDDELAWKLPYQLSEGNEKTYEKGDETWDILGAPRVCFKIRDKFGP